MSVEPPNRGTSRAVLVLAAVVTAVLWQIPTYGDLVLYPFTLLATFAHEMGHGLTALLLGGRFESFVLYPDGSGLAAWRGDLGRVGRALVAAGGLVGPSVAGASLLALSRRPSRAPFLLYGLGGAMLLAAVAVARSPFAVLFVAVTGVSFIVVARRAAVGWANFVVQLLGVQLCVALFQDVSYMFSPGGVVGGRVHGSDSAAMADALLLPYWFWGGVTAAFSAMVLAVGLWVALRPPSPRTGRSA